MTLSLILLAAIAGVGALLWLMEQRTLRRQQDAPEPEPTQTSRKTPKSAAACI